MAAPTLSKHGPPSSVIFSPQYGKIGQSVGKTTMRRVQQGHNQSALYLKVEKSAVRRAVTGWRVPPTSDIHFPDIPDWLGDNPEEPLAWSPMAKQYF